MAKRKSIGNLAATQEQDWQTESDLRTMMECEAIENDPKRLAKVQALAKKKMMDMAAVATEGKSD